MILGTNTLFLVRAFDHHMARGIAALFHRSSIVVIHMYTNALLISPKRAQKLQWVRIVENRKQPSIEKPFVWIRFWLDAPLEPLLLKDTALLNCTFAWVWKGHFSPFGFQRFMFGVNFSNSNFSVIVRAHTLQTKKTPRADINFIFVKYGN